MRPNRRETISLLAGVAPAALSVAALANPAHAEDTKPRPVVTTGRGESQKIETRIGTLEFTHDLANGYPTDATIDRVQMTSSAQRFILGSICEIF
jgi:hypothetical protein